MKRIAPWFILLLGAVIARASDWPDGYYLEKYGTLSPDGRFGLLMPLPPRGAGNEKKPVCLVDVAQHKVLARIPAEPGLVRPVWAPDASSCAFLTKLKPDSWKLLQIKSADGSMETHDLGNTIRDSLAGIGVVSKETGGKDFVGDPRLEYAGDCFRLSIVACTMPEHWLDTPKRSAFFTGVYDPASHQWGSPQALPITEEVWQLLGEVFHREYPGLDENLPNQQEVKAADRDQRLNALYQALRHLLKPERFAALQSEQRSWLGEYEKAAPSADPTGKIKRLEARLLSMKGWMTDMVAAPPPKATGWPAHYVVAEGTTSPDGRYGLLVYDNEYPWDDDEIFETLCSLNYVADLKTRQVIDSVVGVRYAVRLNHAGLRCVWSADSKWAVMTYDRRFGFDSIRLLSHFSDHVSQVDLGKTVYKEIEKVAGETFGYEWIRIDGPLLHMVCAAQDNPKEVPDAETHRVAFFGTYDVNAARWISSRARVITEAQEDQLLDLREKFQNHPDQGPATPDDQLNALYQALRFLMPADRFSLLRQEQREWLTKGGAADASRTNARIRELEALLWSL